MMNYVWAGLVLISCLWAFAAGGTQQVSDALITAGGDAVTMILTVGGAMCLWGGLTEIADRAGITKFLAKCFSPIIRRLMPDIPAGSAAEGAITMNIAANLMGLGNAATPLGITAVKEMSRLGGKKDTATRSMSAFVVLNTASIQLIPSTLAVMRKQAGAQAPLDILPCVWIVSILSLTVGLGVFYMLSRKD